MSRPTADHALRALFVEEIESNARLLQAWLERGFVHTGEDAPEEVLRGLHSINGAARVMNTTGLSILVEVAEQCLRGWGGLKRDHAQQAFELMSDLHAYMLRVAQASSPLDFLEVSAVEQKALCVAFEHIGRADVTRLGASVAGAGAGGGRSKASEQPMLDASLLEIFRTEVEQCAAILSDGLVVLDTEAPSPALWEKLMRAAHSLKGAARIVNLGGVAQLAHTLEDCLVLAQGGSVTLTSADIDVLLQSVDAVKKAAALICDGVSGGRAEAEAIAGATSLQLGQLLGSTPSPMATPPAAAHAVVQELGASDEEATPLDLGLQRTQLGDKPHAAKRALSVISVPPLSAARSVASTAMERASSFPPPSLAPSPGAAAAVAMIAPAPISVRVQAQPPKEQQPERVLRVAAESINALVGLAGESLVESRRVGSFAQGMLRMKKQEMVLIDLIDGIERLLTGHNQTADGPLKDLVYDAKRQARECARLLGDYGTNIEGYVRRAEQLGERLYREALKSRMRPFADGTQGFPRLVRDLGRELGKRARLEIVGQTTEVDRDALESLDAPINHLMRNALDHGIELPEERSARGKPEIATVRIEARHHAGMLSIVVSDDGRGIDVERVRAKVVERGLSNAALAATMRSAELFDFLFLPGFSTAPVVSEISGRGVGLDVVKSSIESLGGSVRISSELGRGTAFHLQLPVTRSVIRAVLAEIDGEAYAFPLMRIDRIARLPLADVKTLESHQYILIDDAPVSLVSARRLLGVPEARSTSTELNVVVVSDRAQHFGIVVDEFRGEHDLVVRPLDPRLGKIPDIAAAAILMDGAAALIVDVDDMVRSIDRMIQGRGLGSITSDAHEKKALSTRKRVLVVDDSITVREAERQLLVNRGYEVDVAVDGVEGLNSARNRSYDLVISDIDMPRMNGIELVRAIKQDPKLGSMPVVIVSYKDREEDRMRGLEAGASYYLTKSSFHDDKLVEAVEDLIGAAST